MKILYYFIPILIVVLIALFSSCKSSKETPSTKPIEGSEELILLKAGSCFGKCKVYQLKIDKLGKVEFHGIKNMEKLGTSSIKLSNDKMEELFMLFEKQGFLDLESEYLSGARDLQLLEITYKGKAVKFHKMKSPQNLMNIFNSLYALIVENNW